MTCSQLLAVDDEIVEGDEVFIVTIEADNPSDSVNGITVVTVSDNDGKRNCKGT